MRTSNAGLGRPRGSSRPIAVIVLRPHLLLVPVLIGLAGVLVLLASGRDDEVELQTFQALRQLQTLEEEEEEEESQAKEDGQARALERTTESGSKQEEQHLIRVGDKGPKAVASPAKPSQSLASRRTKAHVCYSMVHSEIMARVLRLEFNFTDVDANVSDEWDIIVGGYPHCAKGPTYKGNTRGWDWKMEHGLNLKLNERGFDKLKSRQVYHPCMGCSGSYCNKRELCRILKDHVDSSSCFVLPDHFEMVKSAMQVAKAEGSDQFWVSKVDAADVHIHTGSGVSFLSSTDELPSVDMMKSNTHLIQRYNEPFLGKGVWHRKSEMRLYVAITSVYPLRAYAHQKMSVVIAAKEYANTTDAVKDKCMVDTHSSTADCNKFVPKDFQMVLDELGELDSRMVRFKHYADAVGWTDGQRSRLVGEALEMVSTVVRAGHPALERHEINRGIQSSGASCFSWMRVDIGISTDLKPLLFEFPEFFGNFGNTNDVIYSSIRDLYHMIGLDRAPIPQEQRADFESEHLGGWRLLPNLDQEVPVV